MGAASSNAGFPSSAAASTFGAQFYHLRHLLPCSLTLPSISAY
ncbi:MAG: hypothetical protein ACTS5F_01960 [Candidatus Hodgkinia cicadicola]